MATYLEEVFSRLIKCFIFWSYQAAVKTSIRNELTLYCLLPSIVELSKMTETVFLSVLPELVATSHICLKIALEMWSAQLRN